MTDVLPISVVIPAYNAEDFIGEALESVHAQTLPISEIIVVDDGSSDRTANIARSYGASVIQQANRGVSAARNVGIRAATKSWIAFLDADDIWEPEKIQYQWSAIQIHPDVRLVSCDLSYFQDKWLEDGSTLLEVSVQNLGGEENKDRNISYFQQATGKFLLNGMIYSPPTMLIARELLLSVGLFDESLSYHEDFECFLRVLAYCPFAIVKLPLVRRRLHSRNLINNISDMGLGYIKVVERLTAQPEKYPPRAAQAYNKDLSRWSMSRGRSLLDEGRRREARALFVRSLGKSYSARAIFLWCLTFLSPAAFKHFLTIKRKLSKKTRETIQSSS